MESVRRGGIRERRKERKRKKKKRKGEMTLIGKVDPTNWCDSFFFSFFSFFFFFFNPSFMNT